MTSSMLQAIHRAVFLSGIAVAVSLTTVRAAFPLNVQPQSSQLLQRQYPPGSSVTLSFNTLPAPTAPFQWFHDDVAIPGANQATLTLASIAAADSGNYRLQAKVGATTDWSDTVTVNVLPFPASAVDPTFSSNLPASTRVYSTGPFATDGSLIVTRSDSGTFTAFRLADDGRLDPSFSFPSTAGLVLAAFPDGSLLTSQAPYRLDRQGAPITFSLPVAYDAAQPLTAAVVDANGKFLLAQDRVLMRFNADGTVDPSFTYPVSTDRINQLRLDASGRIVVTATRLNPVPTNFPSTWTVVFRLMASGQRDAAFAEQSPGPLIQGSLLVVPLSTGRYLYYSAYHGSRLWKLLLEDGTADPAWSGTTEFTERTPVVNPLTGEVYIFSTVGKLMRYLITPTGLAVDPTFYSGYTVFDSAKNLTIDPTGRLLLAGTFTSWEGHGTNSVARLLPNKAAGTQPPNATAYVSSGTPINGSTVTISSNLTGTGPFTYQWVALDGQPLPANSTSDKLILTSYSTAQFGRYQLRTTGLGGTSVLSNVVALTFSPELPYLANLSGRAVTGSGEDTVIAGLATKISAGALGLPTLLRGAGPSLKAQGVTNFLPNPAIDLYNSSGAVIANNDQWSANPDSAAAAVASGAFPFAAGSNDAALLRTFPTGTATLMLQSQGQGDGVGLLEIYQLFPMGQEYLYQLLTNLSFRARTAPGDNVAIAGFVIVDPQGFSRTARVLLRAVGPTLSAQGITHPLANPVLTVYNSKGEVVAQNDDWAIANTSADATSLAATMKKVGAFDLATDSKDAALLLDLPAGAYSMHAQGGTGVVLLEIYLVR
ncbi:MAG: immunoglobulin domain-containing protein [Opitutus sp.]